MDLAKTKNSIYYSHYMEEDIRKNPSYDLNKRQLTFPGIVNISRHQFSPKSHRNTRILEASDFSLWISISLHLRAKLGAIYKMFLYQPLWGQGWPQSAKSPQE